MCSNPRPSQSGDKCPGEGEETRDCIVEECPGEFRDILSACFIGCGNALGNF